MPTDEPCLFIIADKARARPRGDTEKGCRCGERLKSKDRGSETSHTIVECGNGIPKEREVDMIRDVCEWEG